MTDKPTTAIEVSPAEESLREVLLREAPELGAARAAALAPKLLTAARPSIEAAAYDAASDVLRTEERWQSEVYARKVWVDALVRTRLMIRILTDRAAALRAGESR